MFEIIQNLKQYYRQKQHLLKLLTRDKSGSGIKEILQKIFAVNQQLLKIIDPEKISNFIVERIRDHCSQHYLTDLFWGSKIRQENPGIIPLIDSQNAFLSVLIDKISSEGQFEKLDQYFIQLIQSLQKEFVLAQQFIKDFTALFQTKLELSVIGFGEISTVLEFSGGNSFCCPHPERESWVYKKMPIFPDMLQVEKFIDVFHEYRRLFVEDIGIQVPEQRVRIHPIAPDKIRLYVLQTKFNTQAVGSKLIQYFNEAECSILIRMILQELKKVWTFNRNHPHIKVAIDGQISNWILEEFYPDSDNFTGTENLLYIDTSSPLFRIDGKEQLNAELFLKSTPFFLRPIIRALFLQEVLDRYYDLHLVTVDLIANFFKEGKAEFIPKIIETANEFFVTQMADFNIQPITEQEVMKYYKNDAFIWRFYLAARKIDRFISEKIMRKKYEFRLPEKVKR
jgi:hypothetical protein